MKAPRDLHTRDGGPAFPMADPGWVTPANEAEAARLAAGMSLLDHFAAKALEGLCANPGGPFQANGRSGWGFVNCDAAGVAHVAYVLAEAMLAQRLARSQGEQP